MRLGFTALLLTLGVSALRAQDSASTAPAQVTYVSGTSYYVSRGREDGLLEGSDVLVVRGDSTVARLRVQYLSSHQAACVLVDGNPAIQVGDLVQFTPVLAVQPATRDTARAPSPPGHPGADVW